MRRLDAATELWTEMDINGVSGWFNDMRIDRSTVPPEYNVYELSDDCDGTPCRYRHSILVNFYGTFITKGTLPMDDNDEDVGYINSDDDWGFPDSSMTQTLDFIQVLDRFDKYFKSRKSAFVFTLNNTIGINRCTLLGITKHHYCDVNLAKNWKDDIYSVITDEYSEDDIPADDISKAIGVLDSLYATMVDNSMDEMSDKLEEAMGV